MKHFRISLTAGLIVLISNFAKHFGIILAFSLVVVTLATGCNKPENKDSVLILLVGEWDCIKFAYIADDKTISDVSFLSNGHIEISGNMENKWIFTHTNKVFYDCSLTGNLIKLTMNGSTFVLPPQEELDICEALENTVSFAVKNNELMIYFTGVENKNVLILKKR